MKLFRAILTYCFSHLPALGRWWASRYDSPRLGPIPWAPLRKPLPACRLAVVTTAGVHLPDDSPFDMSNPEGDASFRAIPADTPPLALAITHDYYDHRDADADVNIVLPLQRLRELAAAGEIGGVTSHHFSFMGHITGAQLPKLLHVTAPAVASRLVREQADAVLLTPA